MPNEWCHYHQCLLHKRVWPSVFLSVRRLAIDKQFYEPPNLIYIILTHSCSSRLIIPHICSHRTDDLERGARMLARLRCPVVFLLIRVSSGEGDHLRPAAKTFYSQRSRGANHAARQNSYSQSLSLCRRRCTKIRGEVLFLLSFRIRGLREAKSNQRQF